MNLAVAPIFTQKKQNRTRAVRFFFYRWRQVKWAGNRDLVRVPLTMARVLYMPMAVGDIDDVPRPRIGAILTVNLPAWLLFPDGTRGTWSDCYRDPNKTLLLNTALYILDLAQKLDATAYIETIADCELMCNANTTVARFYRIFVPLSETAAREACIRMSSQLQTRVTEVVNPQIADGSRQSRQTAKRRRRDSSAGSNHSADMSDVLTNTQLGVEHIHSEQVLLQYYSTIATGDPLQHAHSINWTMPPQELTGADGALDDDDDNIFDIDSDDEAEAGSDTVSEAFTAFYNALPENHPLKIFGFEERFAAGLGKFGSVHAEQLDMANYWTDGNVFNFPDVCKERNLVTVIKHGWPGFQTNGVNDLVGNFALPAATQEMSTLELFKKMEEMHNIQGTSIDPTFSSWPFAELKERWLTHGISNTPHANGRRHDPSYYSFIEMIPPRDHPQLNFDRSKSDTILEQIYPALGRLQFGVHQEWHSVHQAFLQHKIDEGAVVKWRRHLLQRVKNLFMGQPKAGFVQAYFRVLKESSGIITMFAAPTTAVIKSAKTLLSKQYANMDAGNALQRLLAGLLSGQLHLTPAQSSTTLFLWNASMCALKPEIGGSQTVACLHGQSDSGKSACMETTTELMPQSAVVRKDTASKMSFTANQQLGVHLTDEFKLGVPSSNDKNVEQLSVLSTGMNVHERLILAQNADEITHNESVIADGRQFLITATNEMLTSAYASRVLAIYCPGTEVEGGRTRQEMTTINNDSIEYQAAVQLFRYIWSLSATVHTMHQVVPIKYCTALRPLFYSLTKKILGTLYCPAPRQVDQIMELSKGYMHARCAAEYTALPETHRKLMTFFEYVACHPVIQMTDMLQCFTQREQNTDIEHETSQVTVALLDSICMSNSVVPELVQHDSDYFVTTLKTVPDICQKCSGGLQNAIGIVTDVFNRMLRGGNKASPPPVIIINKRGEYTNHIAIHKLVLQQSATLHTKAHTAIIEFLVKDVLHENAGPQAPTMFYFSFCEQWIDFRKPVRDRIRGDYTHTNRYADCQPLRQHELSDADFNRALLIWEEALLCRFRDKSQFPSDISSESAIVSMTAVHGGVPVNRCGPLDPMRFLPTYFDTHEDDMDEDWIMREMVAARMFVRPVRPAAKSKLRTQNVLQVAHSLLKPYLDNRDRMVLKMPTVPHLKESKTLRDNAIKRLWNTAAAITGELKVGNVVINGIDHRSLKHCNLHTIQKIRGSAVRLKNPHRHTGVTSGAATKTIEMTLFPSDQTEISFPVYGTPLIDQLNKKAAVTLNGMPEEWVQLHN